MSKSTSPKATAALALEALPADVLQNIASRMRPKSHAALRATSKATQRAVPGPYDKELKDIQRLAEVFRTAQVLQHEPVGRRDPVHTFHIYAYDDHNVLWSVILTYKVRLFLSWHDLTIIKYRQDKQELEGAIRMDFNERNRVQSFKAANKTWLIAFIFTVLEWMGDWKKYEAYVKNDAFMDTRPFARTFEFGVGWKEPVIRQVPWLKDMNHDHLMGLARLMWTRKRHEDKDFAELMRNSERRQYPNKPPKAAPATAAAAKTPSSLNEGAVITLAMRADIKRREAFLNEGMLGHNAAVAKHLTKKSSRRT